jgi:murein DD-endopeptidase MepM/ murein hydrolase activator NlpD
MSKLGLCIVLLCTALAIAPAQATSPSALPILGKLRFEWPIQNAALTSAFGYRTDVKLGTDRGGADASLHFGLDLIPANVSNYQARHTQILAAEAGEVYIVYPPPNGYFKGHASYGGCVMLKHLVGTFGGRTIYAYTLYAHMKEVWVSELDHGKPTKVKQGQPLGLMGSTGQSTGPHLHFEILFDPMDFLLMTSEMEKATQDARLLQAEIERKAWLKQKY